MIYRLKELKGDTIAVPQLVFSKLGIAEEYNVRVALYVLATGITDPDKICADLKLRSRISAGAQMAVCNYRQVDEALPRRFSPDSTSCLPGLPRSCSPWLSVPRSTGRSFCTPDPAGRVRQGHRHAGGWHLP